MFNESKKFIIHLDTESLEYMFLNYTKKRNYPVMSKLYSLLHDGFVSNKLVTPLSLDHLYPHIKENLIDPGFLQMMGNIGQLQFHQRFTVYALQLIRIINYYFKQNYSKPVWKDAFTNDPDSVFKSGFNKYISITARNVKLSYDRENKYSQLDEFITSYNEEVQIKKVATQHFNQLWEQYSDLISPHFPSEGSPEINMAHFLLNEEIQDIPEFHIYATIMYHLFESIGCDEFKLGRKDDVIAAAENLSAYMPYCHYFVTMVDVAELVTLLGLSKQYSVNVYDHNEDSLYKLIDDLTELLSSASSASRFR